MNRYLFTLLVAVSIPVSVSANPYRHGHTDSSLANAFNIGSDTDGTPLYLCVTNLYHGTQPGKTWPGHGRCNVAYGGKEYVVNDFKIPSRHLFRSASWKNTIEGAVVIGKESNGAPLFLCQAFFKGSKQPGKTWPGYNHCNISYAGREIITDNYRILGTNNVDGRHHQHSAPRVIVQHG